MFRFHVINLPHTETVVTQSSCAYTNKVRRFCDMMHGLGHEVYLYASTSNDAACTEHIVIMPKERQRHYWGDAVDKPGYPALEWQSDQIPYWAERNANAIAEISKRVQPKDFIIFFDGRGKPVMDYFMPITITVEAGSGYSGTFARHVVWESYAWMHAVYGQMAQRQNMDVMSFQGRNYDAVIPNSYHLEEFEMSATPIKDRTYALYIGRMVTEKGIEIAELACKAAGVELLLAGGGDYQTTYGKRLGLVGPDKRKELMANARVVLVPTLYLEPFGGVSAEAMLSGAPVITSDWGAFSENVQNGVTGWRCRTLQEWVGAVKDVNEFDQEVIRREAIGKFSTMMVRHHYHYYFEKLMTLWGEGWNTLDQ